MSRDQSAVEVSYKRLRCVDEQIAELKKERKRYQEELLAMVGDEDHGEDIWHDYRENLKELGRKIMKLQRERRALYNDLP